MTYKLTDNGIINLATGMFIPDAMPNQAPHKRAYLAWVAEGNTPEPADPPPPPPANWRGFLADMRGTTVFANLRGQARVDVAANALATELRTVLGEAALGMAEPAVVQGLLDELLPSLSPAQVDELDAAIVARNIPLSTGA